MSSEVDNAPKAEFRVRGDFAGFFTSQLLSHDVRAAQTYKLASRGVLAPERGKPPLRYGERRLDQLEKDAVMGAELYKSMLKWLGRPEDDEGAEQLKQELLRSAHVTAKVLIDR